MSSFLLQDDNTHSQSFCGIENDDYPDKLGMGYPFNKQWHSREGKKGDDLVEDIVDSLPHTYLSRFKIYRYKKLEAKAVKSESAQAFEARMTMLFSD